MYHLYYTNNIICWKQAWENTLIIIINLQQWSHKLSELSVLGASNCHVTWINYRLGLKGKLSDVCITLSTINSNIIILHKLYKLMVFGKLYWTTNVLYLLVYWNRRWYRYNWLVSYILNIIITRWVVEAQQTTSKTIKSTKPYI